MKCPNCGFEIKVVEPAKYTEREIVKQVGVTLEIDDKGRVWRVARFGKYHEPEPTQRHRIDRLINNGYRQVVVSKEGRPFAVRAHRLVWQYSHGDIPEGWQIHHLDGDRGNNTPENLVASPPWEHRTRFNLNAKITQLDAEEIRDLYATGEYTQQCLAECFNLTVGQISKIINHLAWIGGTS